MRLRAQREVCRWRAWAHIRNLGRSFALLFVSGFMVLLSVALSFERTILLRYHL